MNSHRQQRTSRPHVLEGATVRVLPGAVPVGWDEDSMGEFTDHPGNGYRTVTDFAGVDDDSPYGSFEVGGWWWDPRDLLLN